MDGFKQVSTEEFHKKYIGDKDVIIREDNDWTISVFEMRHTRKVIGISKSKGYGKSLYYVPIEAL